MSDVVKFGSYRNRGMTIPEILMEDAGWTFWAFGAGAFDRYEKLAPQARLLHRCAKSIRIPTRYKTCDCIHYWFDGKRFSHLEFGTTRNAPHVSASVITRDCLDLSLAWQINGYDKASSADLIQEFRSIWLKGKALTRKRLHSFFSEESNFLKP